MFFKNMKEIKKLHRENGGHFFSRGAIHFFHSIIYQRVYRGCYFITSEAAPYERRRYTIRRVTDDGDVVTVGEFQEYASHAQAENAIEKLAE